MPSTVLTRPERWRAAVERLAVAILAPMVMPQRPDRTVADTIASVFRHAEYVRSTRDTIWSRVLRWIGSLLRRLFARSGDHPAGRTVAIVLLVALGAIVAGRLLYAAWREAKLRGVRAGWRRDARGPGAADPWAAAHSEAAAGRYVEAAHALYQALLAGHSVDQRCASPGLHGRLGGHGHP